MGTIAGWNYALDWATWRFGFVRKVLEPPPLLLVKDGRMMRANMRRELISPGELMSSLREQGVDKLEDVKRARMEPNGRLSVIKEEGAAGGEPRRPLPSPAGTAQ